MPGWTVPLSGAAPALHAPGGETSPSPAPDKGKREIGTRVGRRNDPHGSGQEGSALPSSKRSPGGVARDAAGLVF